MTIRRRTFIRSASGALGGWALSRRLKWLRPSVASSFPGNPPAFRIGVAYLARRPAESNYQQLRRLLDLDLPRKVPDAPDWSWLIEHVGQVRICRQIEDDFACGKTVQLNGWILSETEARLCALVAVCDRRLADLPESDRRAPRFSDIGGLLLRLYR